MEMPKDWRQECERLQAELEAVRAEMLEWKEKWERLMQFKDAPRLPVRGLNNITGGGRSTDPQTYTTVGWVEGDDFK